MEAEIRQLIEEYGDLKYTAGLYDTKATNAGGPKLAIRYRDLANKNKRLATELQEKIFSKIKS